MNEAEKRRIVFGYYTDWLGKVPDAVVPADERASLTAAVVPGSAGYVPGVERLGIPAQYETDASLGVRIPISAAPACPPRSPPPRAGTPR